MNKKGFTLIEVLVSLTLVSVIAIFLFQIIYILRDIYIEKSVKSELYIETSNISNIINKDILKKTRAGNISNVNKIDDDNVKITYSNGTNVTITINKEDKTISYGNYKVTLLPGTKIGNIELYHDYESALFSKNGVAYIKIPISYEKYNNDFSVIAFFRYASNRTGITG